MNDLLKELTKPFHPSHIIWKPGAVKGNRALAMPYADLRAYMNRLDEVCGSEWSVSYEPWGQDRIICRLTIAGVTRSSTGEGTNESEKSEIGGTVAEAQAFKRACAMFGLGRYLYTLPSGWEDYDPATRKFTDKAKAKLTGLLVQHYRRATEKAVTVEGATVAQESPQRAPVEASDDAEYNGPTDEELEVLGTWRNPQEAQAWSVEAGACENMSHAGQAWMNVVKACKGFTQKNAGQVYLAFLRDRNEKLQEPQAVAA